MNRILLIFILIAMSASSCDLAKKTFSRKIDYSSPNLSDKEVQSWNRLTGKWYGCCIVEKKMLREWLVDRKNDGSYTIEFHTVKEDGKTSIQIEKGEWGLSANIYFTIFKSFRIDGYEDMEDLTDPYIRDTYKVLKLNNKVFEYRHIRTGEKFKVVKVDPTFELIITSANKGYMQ